MGSPDAYSEVAALKYSDVVAADGSIKTEFRLTAEQTKGGYARTVFVSDKLRKELAAYVKTLKRHDRASLALFGTQKRDSFTANTLCQYFHCIRPAKSSCGSELAQGCSCPRHFIADTWTLQELSCRVGGHGGGTRPSSESKLCRRAGSPACRSQPLHWPTA